MQDDNLYISEVTVEDRGLYVCRAENRDGTAQASAIVEVESKSIFPGNTLIYVLFIK